MTHLSDEECAGVDDVQEVPEAARERGLERRGRGEWVSRCTPFSGQRGTHPQPTLCEGPTVTGTAHTGDERQRGLSLLGDPAAVLPGLALSKVHSERPLRYV